MFSKQKNTPATPASSNPSGNTVIGAGATFEGVLKTSEDVLIEGQLNGSVTSDATVLLNTSAKLKADVEASCVVVHGEIVGNVVARERLDIGATGRIRGDVTAGAARVAEGGVLDGTCCITPDGAAKAPSPAPSKKVKEEKAAPVELKETVVA